MGRILMVSKPVVPPWNDSSKNLVRDLASHMRRHQAMVMTRRGEGELTVGVQSEPIYPRGTASFAPGLRDNAIVLARLLAGPGRDLWHFFFAPNRRSSRACAIASRARRVPTVQTVCSAPAETQDVGELLFADRTVVLSRHTEALFIEAGVPREAVRRIAPCASPLSPPTDATRTEERRALGLPEHAKLLVYPGDLEFGGGAELSLRAFASMTASKDAYMVMACRAKTPRAQAAEVQLRELSRELDVDRRMSWLGETPRIHALLGCADVVLLPATSLYAKMDLPMVLIEAMFLSRPVVVAEGTPAAELTEDGAGRSCVAEPDALAATLDELLADDAGRRDLGEGARLAAEKRYHPATMAAAYEALYDELLG
ncbi:MAG: glycosyltransferase family 4 protein [Myxococcales bacterium]|jgi:glycosyltransferase involved in cell wall biosynthesis